MENSDEDISSSLYDYFYYDYLILSKLLDLTQIEEFLRQNESELKDHWKAYLYFIELSITDLYSHIESFINDYPINRFLTDYDGDFPPYIIENYLKPDPFVSRIYKLDSIRTSLSTIRLKKEFKSEELLEGLKPLQEALDEMSTFISKEYGVKRKRSDPAPINFPVLNYLLNIYGHIQYQNIPLAPFFRILPRKLLGQYAAEKLTDSRKYFQGYVLFFFYLCKCFGADVSHNIKDTVNNLKDLRELHEIGSEIYEKNISSDRSSAFTKLFKEDDKPLKRIRHVKKAITKFEQLEFMLGNSDVRLINPYEFFGKPLMFSGGETKTDDLLLTILYGELSRLKIGEKLEIIRFSHYIKNKMEDTWYSYAFYMHPGYWLIFDGVGYDTWRLKYTLEHILKTNKNEIEYTALKIKDELLRQYYKKRDRNIIFENYEKGLGGNIKGLLTEFTAVLYLLKVLNASVIEIRANTTNTDVDVVAKGKSSGFIVQAKTTMPVAKTALKKEIREINRHFKKLNKYKVEGSKPIKILFFVGWKYPEMANEPRAFITKRKLFLSTELGKNNIIVASYEDLDFVLKYKEEHNLNGIVKKVLGFEDGFVFG
jgi:hypothetical protein